VANSREAAQEYSPGRKPWVEVKKEQAPNGRKGAHQDDGRTSPMNKVNIFEKFQHIHEFWKPYIAAELNGQSVKLDKLKGEFIWHHHENEDEMFLVVKGRFRMEYREKDFRDRHIWIEEGEFVVVPRGVEHRPAAEEEAWIMLFEPASTLNTGNVENEMTLHDLERV